jgi:branched-chain amino acid transport system substrate-binding protein
VILAAVPLAIEEGIYSFTATTSYEYVADFYPWAISWYPPTTERSAPIVYNWLRYTGGTRVVQFVENYGVWAGMARAHEGGIAEAKATLLRQVDIPSDAYRFGDLVDRALEENPDSIIFACNPQKIPGIIAVLKARGWDRMNNHLIFYSGDAPDLYSLGGSDINGVMVYNYTDPGLSTPRWNAFRTAYKAAYNGSEPPSLSPNYYDAVYMIKRAIEQTGITGDPSKREAERILLRDYCNEIQNFEGVQFTWSNYHGYAYNKPLFLFEIQNGRKVKVMEIIPD